MKSPVTAYQLKVCLKGTEPLVWRRLEVLSNMSLNNLSFALNLSMGWDFCHLYLFQVDGEEYGDLEHSMGEWDDDKRLRIRDLVKKDICSFTYLYDFGDGWQHEVTIEKEVQAIREEKYPRCIEGENACPPEDCGGIGGFAELKKAISDPKHPRHEELRDWAGEYDPSKFDLFLTNMKMVSKRYRKILE